jgi:hypothetical protein
MAVKKASLDVMGCYNPHSFAEVGVGSLGLGAVSLCMPGDGCLDKSGPYRGGGGGSLSNLASAIRGYFVESVLKYGLLLQVGNLTSDQTFWAPPENMTQTANPRPVFTINTLAGTIRQLAFLRPLSIDDTLSTRQWTVLPG